MDIARPGLTARPAAAPAPAPVAAPARVPSRARRRLLRTTLVMLLIAVTGYFGWELFLYVPPESVSSSALPGEFHPSQGNLHLRNGQPFSAYSTDPPTSGPHWIGGAAFTTPKGRIVAIPPAWGVYDEELPKEALVHAMEHGGVIVWYNSGSGCDAECQASLTRIVTRYLDAGRHVILVPYHGLHTALALTAWTRLERLDRVDISAIDAFVTTHDRRYDPEGI